MTASQSGMLIDIDSEQIAVRLPRALLAEIDGLVARGAFATRADAVRAGVEAVIRAERDQASDRAIVDGYRRQPPTRAEVDASIASMRDAILEEPW